VAALLAAASLENDAPFRRLLRQAESDALPPLALAQLLGNLLRARIGDEAAESWRAAYLHAIAARATPP
jgi:hypothetical protein